MPALAAGVRYGLLESGVLPRQCVDFAAPACALKWLVVQSFLDQRLGWLSLGCGLAAFVANRRALAWGGWITGLAGLLLYSFDYAAVGAMLSLLVLVRSAPRRRHREEQAGEQPADGLRVGRLH